MRFLSFFWNIFNFITLILLNYPKNNENCTVFFMNYFMLPKKYFFFHSGWFGLKSGQAPARGKIFFGLELGLEKIQPEPSLVLSEFLAKRWENCIIQFFNHFFVWISFCFRLILGLHWLLCYGKMADDFFFEKVVFGFSWESSWKMWYWWRRSIENGEILSSLIPCFMMLLCQKNFLWKVSTLTKTLWLVII